MSKQHTITALVENEAGTINRLVSMFRRRGISLASFNAGDCEQEGYSRLTLVVDGDEAMLHQTLRQLEKLIDVVEVEDLAHKDCIARELALIRVDCGLAGKGAVSGIAKEFLSTIPRETHDSIFVECTSDPARLDQLLRALEPYGIGEVVRSGMVAIRTSEQC
jgi:acetolactate synthase-1/3 small subunit